MNIYTAPDQSGRMALLVADANGAIRTYTQRVDTDEESAWSGVPLGQFASVEVQHRVADLDGLDGATLARWQITRSVEA